jgi:hypothetical protein
MIKLKTLIDVLLSLLLARILIKGASIGDSLAFISLAGCYGAHELLIFKHKVLEYQKKPDPSKEILDKLELLEKKIGNTESKIATMTIAGRGLR